ncbi:hypothetical protein, partial [Aeromicrobium sp. Leaf272]|uniref:hypothetical protein n=1 Tax=Aeromicrobium sp. Leaf272 TaxID=1736317 RepID=UPI0019108BA3
MEIPAPTTVLASGIDALYLTGRCVIPSELLADLEQARALAGELRQPTRLRLGGETFNVGWGPLNRWRFRLEHRCAMVGMTASDGIPSLYVQPTAEFLHANGAEAVSDWCQSVFAELLGHITWQVSRVDLFADVQGWDVKAEDRHHFLTRATSRRTYEDDDELTGLQWGVGGAVVCRIYDKTRESALKGTDWWPNVWGPAFEHGKQVIRIEFQVRRDALREFTLGTPDDV